MPNPITDYQPSVPTVPRVSSMGTGASFTGAFSQGQATSIGGSLWRYLNYIQADQQAGENDLISEEDFNKSYSMGERLKWQEGMSLERAQLMLRDTIHDSADERNMRGGSLALNLVGGLAGNMTNPIDFVVGVAMPEISLFSKGVSVAAKTAPRFLSRTGNMALGGLAEGTVSAGVLLGVTGETQQQYNFFDAGVEALASGGFGLLVGAGRSTFRAAMPSGIDTLQSAAMDAAANGRTSLFPEDAAVSLKEDFVKDPQKTRAEAQAERYKNYRPESVAGDPPPQKASNPYSERSDLRPGEKPNVSYDEMVEDSFEPKTANESLINDTFYKLFGVNVRFFDEATSRRHGIFGMTSPDDASTIFVRTGQLDGSPSSMLGVAGHEVGHTIRMRNPETWRTIVDTMTSAAHAEDDDILEVMQGLVNRARNSASKEAPNFRNFDTTDEFMAAAFGQVIQRKSFWTALYKKSPSVQNRLLSYFKTLANQARKMNTAPATALAKALGEVIANAEESGKLRANATGAGFSGADAFGYTNKHSRFLTDLYARYGWAKEGSEDFLDIAFPQIWTTSEKKYPASKTKWIPIPEEIDDVQGYLASRVRMVRLLGMREVEDLKKSSDILDKEISRVARKLDGLKSRKNQDSAQIEKGQKALTELTQERVDLDNLLSGKIKDLDQYRGKDGAIPAIISTFGHSRPGARPGTKEVKLHFHFNDEFIRMFERGSKETDANQLRPKTSADTPIRDGAEGVMPPAERIKEPDLPSPEATRLEQSAGKSLKDTVPVRDYANDSVTKQDALDEFNKAKEDLIQELLDTIDAQDEFGELTDVSRKFSRKEVESLRFQGFTGNKATGALADLDAYISVQAHNRAAGVVGMRYNDLLSVPDEAALLNAFYTGEMVDMPMFGGNPDDGPQVNLLGNSDKNMNLRILKDEPSNSYMARLDEAMEAGKAKRIEKIISEAQTSSARLEREVNEISGWMTADNKHTEALINSEVASREMLNVHTDIRTKAPAAKPESAENPDAPKTPEDQLILETEINQIQSLYHNLVTKLQQRKRTNDFLTKEDYYKDHQNFKFATESGLSENQAFDLVIEDLIERGNKEIQIALLNNTAETRLNGIFKNGLRAAMSFMDGVFRKDGPAATGSSVQAKIEARMSVDTAPFYLALRDHGLVDAWNNNGPIVRETFREMRGEATGNPAAKAIAKILKSSQAVGVARLNRAGARIKFLPSYVMSTIHEGGRIKDKAKYMADLEEWIDWNAYPTINTQKGRQQVVSDAYFASISNAPENFKADEMIGNVKNINSRSRIIHLLPGNEYDYDMAYGSGNPSGQMTTQIAKRAEQSVILENYGPNYQENWSRAFAGRKEKARGSGDSYYAKWVNTTFDHQTGQLDHPVDTKVAAIGQTIRSYMNLVAGWTSGVSSINDAAGAVSMLRWAGADPKGINRRFMATVAKHVKDNDKAKDMLVGMNAGLQALIQSSNRAQGSTNTLGSRVRRMGSAVFRLNGQEDLTRIYQSAYADLMSQHLGDMAGMKQLPPAFKSWLSSYGIDELEFKRMAKAASKTDPNEPIRLAPNMVIDTALSDKLRIAVADSMSYAVLQPSISVESLMRMGTRDGTVFGSALRTLGQYKSFPLTLIQKMGGRLRNGYGADKWSTDAFANTPMMEYLAYSSSMMALGAVSLSIKDILRNREPLNPFDPDHWTATNLQRLTVQAGFGASVVYDFIDNPSQLLGPVGMAGTRMVGSSTGDGYSRLSAVAGVLPGASIPFVNESLKGIIATVSSDAMSAAYSSSRKRIELVTGQKPLIDF